MTNLHEIDKSELKNRLSKQAYDVTQHKATEAPFSGKYLDNHEHGMYNCVVCGQKLFDSDAKFESGSGWPSFDQAIPGTTELIPRQFTWYAANRGSL